MKNIRLILLGELVLIIIMFSFLLWLDQGISSLAWFIDIPSLLMILFMLVCGLVIMGEWRDFIKAFSVGIRQYSLLELKNIIAAVDAAQKLTIFGALFSIIASGILVLGNLNDYSVIGPNLAICFLTGLYAVVIEFFLLPLRINAEIKMNEEMDLGDE